MDTIATSYVNFSNSTILFAWIVGAIVLVGLGATRSCFFGFWDGGFSGLVMTCFVLHQSGGIFAFVGYIVWIPVIALASTTAGGVAAGIGKWIGTKFGKDPWDRL